MPLINAQYNPKGWFKNGHFSTIYSAKVRQGPVIEFQRERITMNDGDFLDLDWAMAKTNVGPGTKSVVILLHGLEGNAQRSYIRGQAATLLSSGFNICAMNFRGCSGTDNLRLQSYNAGKIEDLDQVVRHVTKLNQYSRIYAVGFSLGGSLLLNYLGAKKGDYLQILRAAVVSTPLDLSKSIQRLGKWDNRAYQWVFLSTLKEKYRQKQRAFPQDLTIDAPRAMTSLKDFDNLYTAPVHGYLNAEDYYQKNSPINTLEAIEQPVLILNALNDSFLSEACLPVGLAQRSKNIYLEAPKYGGHVGFYAPSGPYYNETRVSEFFTTKPV
jgi:predicted alpha/beta-fold hydrolase